MSVVGINFGSATSGTGFDVTSTVNSILALQRRPETAWAARTATLQKQDAVLSSLGGGVSSLTSALSTLTAFDGVFAQKQGALSDSSSVALTRTDATAVPGSHTITVSQIATTSAQHSSAVPSGDVLSGSFTLQVGGGAVHSLALGVAETLVTLANRVNALGAGVTATVLTDSAGQHLSLLSANSGAAGQITVGGGVSSATTGAVSFTQSQAGADAAYTIDGVPLTSDSNTLQSVLPGVTLQLIAPTAGTVRLEVANDEDSIATALAGFVSAFNSVATSLAAQEKKGADGAAQPLYGDPTLSLLQLNLANALTFGSGDVGASTTLAQLGLSVGIDGQLTLNTTALDTALRADFVGAADFFQTAGAFGQNFLTVLHGIGASANGAIALRSTENAAEEKQLVDNKESLEQRLTTSSTRLTNELSIANQILQGIPQRLNEVKQIYAAITGYGSNG